MGSKFEFDGEWPPEVRAVAEPLLERFAWLVPSWCHTVSVQWEGDPGEDDAQSSARTQISFAYRSARLQFLPMFLTDSERQREADVIHELLHLSIQPLCQYAMEVVDRCLKEESPKFHETVIEELRVRNEGAVEDLMHAIQAKTLRDDAARPGVH